MERDAKGKTLRESVIALQETRLSSVSQNLIDSLNNVEDMELLKQLQTRANTAYSIAEFDREICKGKEK